MIIFKSLIYAKIRHKHIRYGHAPLWGLNVIQILNVQDHLLRLFFGRLGLLLCEFQVGTNHILQRLDIHLRGKSNSF